MFSKVVIPSIQKHQAIPKQSLTKGKQKITTKLARAVASIESAAAVTLTSGGKISLIKTKQTGPNPDP